jgi:hypothetical protein
MPEVVAVKCKKVTTRNLDKAVRKFAKFFNVDNNLDHVIDFGRMFDMSFGTSDTFVFLVADDSAFDKIAINSPQIFDVAVIEENDRDVVVVL